MAKINLQRSTIINVLLIAALLIILLVPDAKAGIMSGLMKIGLFKPDVHQQSTRSFVNSNVRFKDGDGKVLELSELKGKVVLINFWATWCPPCRAEMPSLNNLYKQFENNADAIFITVDADHNYQKAKKFLDRRKYKLPLYTVASELPAELFSGKLPTTIVLDKQGKLAFRHEGMADYSDKKFVSFLNGLLR
jgi:thiol-disulfide isomerase/thioredoxin